MPALLGQPYWWHCEQQEHMQHHALCSSAPNAAIHSTLLQPFRLLCNTMQSLEWRLPTELSKVFNLHSDLGGEVLTASCSFRQAPPAWMKALP